MRSHAIDDFVPAIRTFVNYDVDLDASSGYRVTAKMKVVEMEVE